MPVEKSNLSYTVVIFLKKKILHSCTIYFYYSEQTIIYKGKKTKRRNQSIKEMELNSAPNSSS